MTERKKAIKEYDIILQKYIHQKDCVRIMRTFRGIEENISGFLLSFSKDFLLVQVDDEFLFDGYAIIRKDQFDSLRCNRFDKAFKNIYKKEGRLDKEYGIDIDIPLNSWQDIFKELRKNDYHVIVECEDKEEPDFVIGPIKRILKHNVGIQYHDPAGRLENGFTLIKYEDITFLKFGDRYSTTFRKYLKQSNSTK